VCLYALFYTIVPIGIRAPPRPQPCAILRPLEGDPPRKPPQIVNSVTSISPGYYPLFQYISSPLIICGCFYRRLCLTSPLMGYPALLLPFLPTPYLFETDLVRLRMKDLFAKARPWDRFPGLGPFRWVIIRGNRVAPTLPNSRLVGPTASRRNKLVCSIFPHFPLL